jgi:endonuclease/exonuclease/phosphatase (EEP) superfamily protein YafD
VKWLRCAVRTASVAYPIALVALAATLRYVGESWWISAAGLYLPRALFALPLPFICIASFVLGMRRHLWLQAASAVVLLFPLMGFALPGPVSQVRGAPTLRVLSFNIDSGRGGVEAVVDEIGRYSPDVVLLQEVSRGEALVRLLRSRYPTVELSTQFVLATRYRVISTREPGEVVFEGKSRRLPFVEYVLETPLGPVVFYNVHPSSPRAALYALRGAHGLKREITSGHLLGGSDARLLQDNAGPRALEAQTVTESATNQTAPVILGGDTNLPGLSPVFSRLFSKFEDGFSRAGWGFGYTFPTNKWRPWMRIDRILANDRLRFVGFEVGDSRVSDHRCVVAELQAAEQAGPSSDGR